jgi:hypothetical protein
LGSVLTPSDGNAVEEFGVAKTLDSAAGTPPTLDSTATPTDTVEESGAAKTLDSRYIICNQVQARTSEDQVQARISEDSKSGNYIVV